MTSRLGAALGKRRTWHFAWVVLLLLVAWAYWPGISGPLLLDDWENLKMLERIEQQPEFARDIVADNVSGPTGRPVSMLSFVAEKLYFDRGVAGQKQLGILIHLINACLVYMLIGGIVRASGHIGPAYWGVLGAGLWLSAPLLLSTTLYVVQRMTLLSAGFGLLSLLMYCLARERQLAHRSSAAHYLACLLALLLSVFSKENGLLVLPMMSALEVFVFRGRAASARMSQTIVGAHAVLVMGGALGALLLLMLAPEWLLAGYADRDFTVWQRLLTQTRILWAYMGQFFWPDVHVLGVYHDDIAVSQSLFAPLSTLVSMLAWLLAMAAIVASAISGVLRVAALGLLVYLLGHAMESSVLPLELYFEHRNYLPAMGLALMVVGLGVEVSRRIAFLTPWLAFVLVALLLRHTLLLGSQAIIWSDNTLLHMEAVNSHPDSARAHYALAQIYARHGALEEAASLVRRAAELEQSGDLRNAVISANFHCIANSALPGDHWAGLTAAGDAMLKADLSNQVSMLIDRIVSGLCPALDAEALAVELKDLFLQGDRVLATPRILGALMFLENYRGNFEQALYYADLLYAAEPEEVISLQFQLYLASALDLQERREAALQELLQRRDAGLLSRQETYNLELFIGE